MITKVLIIIGILVYLFFSVSTFLIDSENKNILGRALISLVYPLWVIGSVVLVVLNFSYDISKDLLSDFFLDLKNLIAKQTDE